MSSLQDVRNFWEEHPLCAYEIPHAPGSKEFFQSHDALKVEHTDRFNMHLWDFAKQSGKRVLDVGCGPGWLVQEYAKGQATAVGLDLTFKAANLAKQRLQYQSLKGNLLQANAEQLPFKGDSFDFVSCSGVLHHTPNTEQAISEIHRVLKPGGRAVVSLYFSSFFFRAPFWSITRAILRRLFLKTGFRNESKEIESADDFVRLYDGDKNPLGKAYSVLEVKKMFHPFRKVTFEFHYFPKRFFDPYVKIENSFILKCLDRTLGTMIFAMAEK